MFSRKIYRSFYRLLFICSCCLIYYLNILGHNTSIWKEKSLQEYPKEWEKMYPNVPFDFLFKKKNILRRYCSSGLQEDNVVHNNKSTKTIFGITLNNDHWQKYETKFGILYLYNAYFDNRRKRTIGSKIRIIAMSDRQLVNDNTNYCLTWYDQFTDPVISNKPMQMDRIIPWTRSYSDLNYPKHYYFAGHYLPYLLTCDIPHLEADQVPWAVSIIGSETMESKCHNHSNYLKVVNNIEEKKNFAVCVKGLYFLKDNLAVRLIEWIEILSILGASKIFLYDLNVHPDLKKVINYYAEKGIVEVSKTSLAGNQPNEPNGQYEYLKDKLWWQRYNSAGFLNDCFYRNIHRYKYIVNLDIDEIIVPQIPGQTWNDLILQLEKEKAYYGFKTTYFFSDISMSGQNKDSHTPDMSTEIENRVPSYLHMLSHIYRSRNHATLVKSFMATEYVKSVGTHYAANCMEKEKCDRQLVSSDIAHVHHYRTGCQRAVADVCNKTFRNDIVKDTSLWQFKQQLSFKCLKTINQLNLKI